MAARLSAAGGEVDLRVYPESPHGFTSFPTAMAAAASSGRRVLARTSASGRGVVDGCLACDLLAGRRPLPGGTIAETPRWAVEHCVGPLGVGTLIVKPKRHVLHVSDLDADEAAELGPLLRRTAAAVAEVFAPSRSTSVSGPTPATPPATSIGSSSRSRPRPIRPAAAAPAGRAVRPR